MSILFFSKAPAAGIDANTVLMLHGDALDSGNTGHPVSLEGGANFSGAAYKFGDGAFQGNNTSTLMHIPSNSDWTFGSSDFTVEFWTDASDPGDVHFMCTGHPQPVTSWYVKHNAPTQGWSFGGVNSAEWNSGYSNLDGNPHHIVFMRSGGTFYLFEDGVQRGSTGISSIVSPVGNLTIGASKDSDTTPQLWVDGYMDEIRISDVARYSTSGFTSPTSPFTSDANTRLLLHTDIMDASDSNHVLSGYYTQLNDTTYKFGTGSMYFDSGNNSYATIPNSGDFAMGTGDFTVELWFKRTGDTGANPWFICNLTDGGGTASECFGLRLIGASPTGYMYTNGGNRNINGSNVTLDLNWHHLALVRNGATLTLYYDGANIGTSNVSTESMLASDQIVTLASQKFNGTVQGYFDGYIDEVRISNVARWTSDFTPPTEQYSA